MFKKNRGEKWFVEGSLLSFRADAKLSDVRNRRVTAKIGGLWKLMAMEKSSVLHRIVIALAT